MWAPKNQFKRMNDTREKLLRDIKWEYIEKNKHIVYKHMKRLITEIIIFLRKHVLFFPGKTIL